MSARRHVWAALLAVAALVLLAVPFTFAGTAAAEPDDPGTPTPTGSPTTPGETVTVTETVTASPEPTTEPTAEPDGAFEVDDAQLRWGLNDETNNRAFAPGTFNFLSAGKVPDPGEGGQRISTTDGTWSSTGARAWSARSGDVRIEKLGPAGTYATATLAGLTTTVAGTTMSGTNGPFSGHQVVLDGGAGQVDTDAGTATIRWRGSFSVVYYSGLTFFTVTDPVLTVRPSGATLTATLGGYETSMDDQSVWTKVPDRPGVVLADLPSVDLGAALGFTARPKYLGVRYTAPVSGTAQVTTGDSWGAFPRSFLDFAGRVGSSSYWYSSGGSADVHKVPSPLTVSYAAGAPVAPPVDESTDDPDPTDEPTDDPTTTVNPTPPPTPPVPSQPAGPALPVQAPATTPPALVAPTGAPVAAAAAVPPGQAVVAPTTYALSSSEATPPGPGPSPPWPWWIGSVLLVAAAALTLLTPRTKGRP